MTSQLERLVVYTLIILALALAIFLWSWPVHEHEQNPLPAPPAIDQPAPNRQERPMRRPVQKTQSASARAVQAPAVVPVLEDPPLAPLPPEEFNDDGSPDLLSGRAAALREWQSANYQLWNQLTGGMRSCVYMQYVNAFGPSPEQAIDDCLDHYEGLDAEKK